MAAAANAGAVLPGAHSALMNKMGLSVDAIRSSFLPTDQSGKELVDNARTLTLSPDGRKFKRRFDEEVLNATEPWAPKSRKKVVNIEAKAKVIPGKAELSRLKMEKKSKRMMGSLAGPTTKTVNGKAYEQTIGKRNNVMDEFPKGFVPRDS